jgi:paraquat-inducible protein B
MKLKPYIYFNTDKLTMEWTDKPVTFKGIEVGKITSSKYNKETNSVDIVVQIHEDKIEEVKKLLGIKK